MSVMLTMSDEEHGGHWPVHIENAEIDAMHAELGADPIRERINEMVDIIQKQRHLLADYEENAKDGAAFANEAVAELEAALDLERRLHVRAENRARALTRLIVAQAAAAHGISIYGPEQSDAS